MNYAKPGVLILGPAGRVIEQIPTMKGPYAIIEIASPRDRVNPANDLEE